MVMVDIPMSGVRRMTPDSPYVGETKVRSSTRVREDKKINLEFVFMILSFP